MTGSRSAFESSRTSTRWIHLTCKSCTIETMRRSVWAERNAGFPLKAVEEKKKKACCCPWCFLHVSTMDSSLSLSLFIQVSVSRPLCAQWSQANCFFFFLFILFAQCDVTAFKRGLQRLPHMFFFPPSIPLSALSFFSLFLLSFLSLSFILQAEERSNDFLGGNSFSFVSTKSRL